MQTIRFSKTILWPLMSTTNNKQQTTNNDQKPIEEVEAKHDS